MNRDITRDTLADGALTILQGADGFRFGIDAVMLATDLPEFDPQGTVVDLGAGQGAVGLSVAVSNPDAEVICLERQPSLLELLRENIRINDLQERVEAREGDVREYRESLEPHSADLVVCNPPYYRAGERRPGANDERAAARIEMHGTLNDFVDAAAYVLDQRGRLKIIVPPLRLGDLYAAAAETDLSFETMRYYHARPDEDAYLVECVLRRGGAPDVRVRPPLYQYGREGSEYGPEVQQRLASLGAT
jgi:tRNA1Val (adenine37-N6)-methyltransferase